MELVRKAAGVFGLHHAHFELWWRFRRKFQVKTDWNTRHRSFFVHIPKTAGTSIYRSLGMDELGFTHAPARVLRALHPSEFDDFFTFSVVRNPWDRLHSTFHYLISGTDWDVQRKWASRHLNLSFEEFVLKLGSNYWFRNSILCENFFFSQSYFVCDRHGRNLVDKIYRFESLQDTYDDLKSRFRLSKNQALAHSRRTRVRATYQDDYTPRMAEIVRSIYAEDVKRFGYTFSLSKGEARRA